MISVKNSIINLRTYMLFSHICEYFHSRTSHKLTVEFKYGKLDFFTLKIMNPHYPSKEKINK